MKIREVIALLMVTSFLIPGAIAQAEHEYGTCDLYLPVGDQTYIGVGEYQIVSTPSGVVTGICSGQLSEDSDVPEQAIRISEDIGQIIITPGGTFSWQIRLVP